MHRFTRLIGIALIAGAFTACGPERSSAGSPVAAQAPVLLPSPSADAAKPMPPSVLLGTAPPQPWSAHFRPDLPWSERNHHYLSKVTDSDLPPGTQAYLQALRGPRAAELETALTPFDPAAYAHNPRAYVDAVEPQRVFATAAATIGATPLRPAGPRGARLQPGQVVALTVQAQAGAPVSWLTQGGGCFVESRLHAVTVVANQEGRATVHFYALPGVEQLVPLFAGSPLHTGTVQFDVFVETPSVPKTEQ